MAHNVEPMDIDSDFDKENSVHNSNVYHRSSCTEKGYEELDVSELNMKLRYSVTPATSPMSKSYTANCIDNKNLESGDDNNLNANLTRSFNSALPRNDTVNKSVKSLPLQPISAEQLLDKNWNPSPLRALDLTHVVETGNVTITVSATNGNNNNNFETPSPSSSTAHTPDAITPTKELPRTDDGSPIMRGLKSVLNMFRSSQSPIPPSESGDGVVKQVLSPADDISHVDSISSIQPSQAVLASTPISALKSKETPKRSSPLKESIVFNQDLEKELLWKDETAIFFKEEKIPIHKLFYPPPLTGSINCNNEKSHIMEENLNTTVEYMDISYCNDSVVKDQTMTDIQFEKQLIAGESDGEFVDCETTFTNDKSAIIDDHDSNKMVMLENNDNPQINRIDSIQPTQQIEETTVISNNISTQANASEANVELSLTKNIPDDDLLQQKKIDNIYIDNDHEMSSNNKVETVDPLPPTDTDKTEEANTPEYLNESNKSQENIEQLLDNQHNNEIQLNENLGCGCLNTEPIQSNPDLQVFEVVSPLDSSDKMSDRNLSENTPAPEEFSELTPIKFVKNDQSVDVEKESIVPANIPLPEEDKFDIEILSNRVNLTSALYSSIIKNTSFDTELESAAHVDSMPNNPAVLANSDENKVICSDIDSIVVGINTKKSESNLEDSLISKHAGTNSHNHIEIAQVDDFTLGIKADIENIVRDAKLIVEEKQKLIPACENLNLNQDEHSEPKNENINVNAEPCLRNAESPQHNHNDDLSNNLKPEIMESMENNNEMYNPCAYNVMNIAETYKDELIHTDTNSSSEIIVVGDVPQDIQGPIGIINNDVILAKDDYKLDLKKCFKNELATSMISTTNLKDIEELSTLAKTELKPDVIPDAMVCNISDQLPVEFNKHFAEKEDIGKDTVSETTTEKALFEDKDEKVDIETISKTTIYEVLFENKDEVEVNIDEETTTERALFENKDEKVDIESISKTTTYGVQFENKDEVEVNIDEKVTMSENNCPFVSIDHETNQAQTQQLNLDECMNPFATKSQIAVSPPISPKISSKGYNFNFDEIDNPFATKTKIRLSPPPNSPEGNVAGGAKEKSHQRDKNRRKSQPERRKPIPKKNIINKTFSGAANVLDRQSTIQTADSSVIGIPLGSNIQDNSLTSDSGNANNVIPKNENELHSKMSSLSMEKTDNIETEIIKEQTENPAKLKNEAEKSDEVVVTEENKTSVESLMSSNEVRHTSSSEQSAYYSAETSTVNTKSKNVFNIPEIDDVNFKPFITKSKVCESASPIKNNSFSYQLNNSSEELCPTNKTSEVLEDKECGNISNITCSSKATDDKDVTVREVEVHTEDEDTIEGPFLETEDLKNVDKISDFDCEDADMMQFSELPTQSNDEQLEGEEMFIDAEAFEFLLNQNKSSAVADSGKESLFLKFDPLFAKRISTDGVLAALNKVQKRQSTPKKVAVAQQLDTTFEKPFPGPSNLNVTNKLQTNETIEESLDDPVMVSKPMMVVTPAVNPIATTRNKSVTPASSNRRSITFTSPAIAVIDRLLNMSGNNSLYGHDSTMTQINREQNEADHALTQLRELLAEKEIQVYNLRSESKELKDRLSTLESQMRALESDGEERLKKINALNEKLAEKTKINKSMAAVVEEYERTIASLIAESEQDKKQHNEERIKLVKERDEQTAHLASMEVSFSDLHSKYEKSKQIILTCKANEDAYKKSIKEFEANLTKMQSNYELLKQHATSKLNHANQELEKMNKAHEAEVLKLNAMIKRKELHITSLEETLAQKTKANEELTAICDELINKVNELAFHGVPYWHVAIPRGVATEEVSASLRSVAMATSDKHCQTFNVNEHSSASFCMQRECNYIEGNSEYVRGMYDETVPVLNAREIESPSDSDEEEVVRAAMAKFNPPVRHTARHDFDSDSDTESEPDKFLGNISGEEESPRNKVPEKALEIQRQTSKDSTGRSKASKVAAKDTDSSNSESDSGDVEGDKVEALAGSGRKRGGAGGVVIPAEGAYDPKQFQDLKVPPDMENIFQYIMKYTPQKIDIEFKLQPFVPEYMPAVGDIDAFIKVATPACNVRAQPLPDNVLEHIDNLGLTVVDEPAAAQSDSALLHLQLRAISKTHGARTNLLTKKVENAEKNSKAIERWIKDVSELHLSKPAPTVMYTSKMPDIDTLMEEWPETMEETLNEVGFPPASLDCSLSQYVELVCAVFDVPVVGDGLAARIQALHLLFSLYSAVKNSQLYAERQKEKEDVS